MALSRNPKPTNGMAETMASLRNWSLDTVVVVVVAWSAKVDEAAAEATEVRFNVLVNQCSNSAASKTPSSFLSALLNSRRPTAVERLAMSGLDISCRA
eukprot:scaffold6345_cov155-Amphora_coffeaeformis.AAC.4